MLENITLASTAENLGAGPCPDPNQDSVGGNILPSKEPEEKKKKNPNKQKLKNKSAFLGRVDVSESSMELGCSSEMLSGLAV